MEGREEGQGGGTGRRDREEGQGGGAERGIGGEWEGGYCQEYTSTHIQPVVLTTICLT